MVFSEDGDYRDEALEEVLRKAEQLSDPSHEDSDSGQSGEEDSEEEEEEDREDL